MPTAENHTDIRAMVIGISAGGVQVLSKIMPQLPEKTPFPIFLVEHTKASGKHYLCDILNEVCALPVCEAEDKMRIEPGHVYLAPPDYHLLIESSDSIALSMDNPVHYCRPSIDMLFESAADVFRSHVLGIVCTGMGRDGADGLLEIHQAGGVCAVEDPATAEYPFMPQAALASVPDAQRISPDKFGLWLASVVISI
ncbi:MAG: chemotaxis protein CheB [Mariprofundaceae bacterium]